MGQMDSWWTRFFLFSVYMISFFCDLGPFGDQDGDQVFVQRIVPDTNQVFVRLASNGDR